ncbi:MAG: hypothetical protein K8R73_12330 [Clostridiales bacterium]|nr:hypothetical protein [Clostridiales bacterium]
MDEQKLETKKLLDFTPDDIKAYLKKLKKLVLDNKYTISRNSNREENIKFMEDFRIDSKKEKEILMNLEFDDFCYAVTNKNPKFSHEILYIFNKEHELDRWGELISVDIYIKTNKTQTLSGEDIIIIVSFHERNKPIKYLFK